MSEYASTSAATFAGENAARRAIFESCRRQGLSEPHVLARFDAYGYSSANLAEIAGWPTETLDLHCRLLSDEPAVIPA